VPPLLFFGPPAAKFWRRAWPEGLISPIFPGAFWTHGRTNIAGISRFEKCLDILGFTDFRPELFVTKCHTENSSQTSYLCRLFFWQYFFSHHLRFMTTGEDRNKDWFKNWKLLRFLKAHVLWPQSDKAHVQLRLLYQSVYQFLCSNFGHSWIPPQGTWTSSPAAVYFRTLAEYTALGVLRDTIPQSFQCWFSFLLGRTQQKTKQMRAEGPVAKIPACSRLPIRPQKANSPSYSWQQWRLCQRVCDCLYQGPGTFLAKGAMKPIYF